MSESVQITWHAEAVSRAEREQLLGQRGCIVWFTGLSGSGKSTIANRVCRQLHDRGVLCYLLDGDNIRHGLNASPDRLRGLFSAEFAERFGLGFSAEDRAENIRRVGAVAQLLCAAGIVTLTAFVSPYREDRDRVRQRVQQQGHADDFIEVFVDTPLEVCEARDPKGLYQKARAGQVAAFTGVVDPYEPPMAPELTVVGTGPSADDAAASVIHFLEKRQLFLKKG